MAIKHARLEMNAPGKYYVDDTCIDCEQCVQEKPEFFAHDADEQKCYVAKQPQNAAEEQEVRDILEQCPTQAVGDDGDA